MKEGRSPPGQIRGAVRPEGRLVWFEEKLIYFPSPQIEETPASRGLRYEEVELVAGDGERLHGWFLPAPGDPEKGPVVLFCHGNAGNISDRLDRVVLMQRELGCDLLVFDYRGFGRSGGRPGEEGTYLDARAAYRHLVDFRSVDPARLVFFGESLGAAVAVELSLREPSGALVLEAPFTSIRAMAKVAYPFLPLGPWVRTRYDNLAKIGDVRRRLLVIHGDRDETVPFSFGEQVFRAAAEPKRFLAVEGAGHSDAYLVGGEAYWRAWRVLLRELDEAARLTPAARKEATRR